MRRSWRDWPSRSIDSPIVVRALFFVIALAAVADVDDDIVETAMAVYIETRCASRI